MTDPAATPQKVPLDRFLARIDPDAAYAEARDGLARVTDRLLAHLGRHPDLAAQVRRLRETVPDDPAVLPLPRRPAARRLAEGLIDDLAEKWIAADDPPLVEEIDARLREARAALSALTGADPATLRETAAEIDRLAARTRHLDDVERRYLPWAGGAGALFVLGVVLLFNPGLLAWLPVDLGFWPVLACLLAFPAVAFLFARRVLPRTRADTAIDALNQQHFLPHGGLYFPAGPGPAGVILVDYTPPDRDAPADPRKVRARHRETW